jgi:hypothetical protein
LPANIGPALARMVGTLLRDRSPSNWMLRMGKSGLRISHNTPAIKAPTAASAYTPLATAFIRRTSAGITSADAWAVL